MIEVRLADVGEAHQDASARALTSEAVVIPTATGLHARPAAVLADSAAKRVIAEVQLRRGDDHANAKSVVGIMGLEVAGGDKVHVVARGPDADAAIATLVPLLREGLGEEGAAPTVVTGRPAPTPAPVARAARSGDPNRLTGVPAAPGLAGGIVVQVRPEHIAIVEDGRTPNEERQRLDLALDQARRELRTLQERLTETADPARASIFAAHEDCWATPKLKCRKLSLNRVESCRKYLSDNGISEDRITTIGYGPDKPIAPNDTEENRAKNRRVELKITRIQ